MSSGNLKDKKILMVVAQRNFRDEEFFEPREIFEDMDIDITVASNSTDEAEGALGRKIKPDISIDDAIAANYDAIVIAGGGGSREYLWSNKKLHKLVQDAVEHDKVVAAICISPVILAKAGILADRKATVFKDNTCIRELKDCKAIYEDAEVIISDNIVTGRDPKAAEKFGEAVLEALSRMGTGSL
ncbi:MAG: DJ-1/PfpI family protein [Methanosarcinaceae archaeon]|nr:DJ-1/PfpI family protein [Methanosarcinaceae archaeon]